MARIILVPSALWSFLFPFFLLPLPLPVDIARRSPREPNNRSLMQDLFEVMPPPLQRPSSYHLYFHCIRISSGSIENRTPHHHRPSPPSVDHHVYLLALRYGQMPLHPCS
ncbi:hypothetical protein B9Z19DRAFT_1073138 [Tuber borchii]|uniref:Uncharacterized protein n=1 Tax=Tuber borchii TaxID=42251 RepID=A0A2T7A6J6_TUBBO|nr:hypothetical protein B9Z19DRAFT_1073138 [Tuber borchii]